MSSRSSSDSASSLRLVKMSVMPRPMLVEEQRQAGPQPLEPGASARAGGSRRSASGWPRRARARRRIRGAARRRRSASREPPRLGRPRRGPRLRARSVAGGRLRRGDSGAAPPPNSRRIKPGFAVLSPSSLNASILSPRAKTAARRSAASAGALPLRERGRAPRLAHVEGPAPSRVAGDPLSSRRPYAGGAAWLPMSS